MPVIESVEDPDDLPFERHVQDHVLAPAAAVLLDFLVVGNFIRRVFACLPPGIHALVVVFPTDPPGLFGLDERLDEFRTPLLWITRHFTLLEHRLFSRRRRRFLL